MTGSPAGRRADVLAALRASPVPLSIADLAERLDVHPNTVRFHLDTLTGTGQVDRVHTPPGRRGRPALLFRARPGMDPAGPRNYRLLAGILAGSVATDPEALHRASEAGRAWGRQLATPSTGWPTQSSAEPPTKPSIESPMRSSAESPAKPSVGSPTKPSVEAPAEPSVDSPAVGEDDAIERLMELLGELGFAPERRRSTDGARQIGLRHCPFLDLVQTEARVVCQVHLALMQGAMAATGASATVDRLEPFAEPDLCLAHLGRAGGTP